MFADRNFCILIFPILSLTAQSNELRFPHNGCLAPRCSFTWYTAESIFTTGKPVVLTWSCLPCIVFILCALPNLNTTGAVLNPSVFCTVYFHFNYNSYISRDTWPSGLAYRTQVLVLATECGFESRPWHLCPWARHLIIIASLHPGVKWVPVRAELVD